MAHPRVEALLRDQIERLWGAGEVGLVDQNYADDVVDHMPIPGQPQGKAALKDVVLAFRTAMPDLRMDLHGVIANGAIGVDFWTLTGTHTGPLFGAPATGRRVRFSGIDMVGVRDGTIRDLWHVEEMLQFFQQVGLDPAAFGAAEPPAPAPCASGAAAEPDADPADLSAREQRTLGVSRRHIEELWSLGRLDVARSLYAPTVRDHQAADGQRPGVDGIVDHLTRLREAAPDLRLSVRQHVVQGDLAACRWVMSGTHTGAPLLGAPAAGKGFTINGMAVIGLNEADQITDLWHVEELASLLAQIA